MVQRRDSPAARIASVTWPPRVVAAPISSSVKVVRARRGTAAARRPTSVVRIGGTAVVDIGRTGEGGRASARPDIALSPQHPPWLATPRRARHAHERRSRPCKLQLRTRAGRSSCPIRRPAAVGGVWELPPPDLRRGQSPPLPHQVRCGASYDRPRVLPGSRSPAAYGAAVPTAPPCR